jgi:PAS domain S-box-containing protein
MKKNSNFRKAQPAIIAIVCFLFLLAATVSYTNYKQGLWEKDIRANLLDVLIGKKSKLEKALYSRIYYTRGVAAFVSLKPDITTEEFNELAREYIKNDSVIGTMALSQNCVINAIYPLKGHEAAIGLDLLKHPERKEIVEKTIETHQTFIAGPVELVEGGIAFISYTPIFDKQSKNKNLFWGVTDIVIKQPSLFNEARFKTPEDEFEFALRGYNGSGKDGAIFWGNKSVFDKNPVTINIDLPIGTWILAGAPSEGWNQFPNQDKAILFILVFSSLIISVLIWLFSRALIKIRQNEKELKAIFGSMDSLIVEYNAKGEYVKIAPTNDAILFRSRNDLIGKSLYDIFDREKADFFIKAIRECLETRELVVIEYPLEINGKDCWFSARISYKSESSVIFNAFDITEKKKDEEIIRMATIRLKEMNAMKDRFFSIIAHDLRNPVGSQKMLIDLLLSDYDTIDEDQRKELLISAQESASGLFSLLEDLLEWSRSQSGNLVIKPQEINLNEFCNNLVAPLLANARLKNIKLENAVSENAFAVSDPDIAGTILRNLVSNAIKFTPNGGEIKISSDEIADGNQKFQRISVIDNGIGIKPEMIESLLDSGTIQSTYGTDNEKGSGFGLSLCNELAHKLGGKLEVTSTPGQGSTFSFTLPSDANSPKN